ncbi:MAG: hypothetical protein GXY87_00065 [Tissierellia bacterium]|nr:hypothetical protein [Tissierellia bacterium]
MKLLLVVVQDTDVNILMEELVDKGYRVTKLSSTGGFLKSGNTTIFMGVEESDMDQCLKIIETNCKKRKTTTAMVNPSMQGALFQTFPVEIEVGGATVFVLNVDQFLKI